MIHLIDADIKGENILLNTFTVSCSHCWFCNLEASVFSDSQAFIYVNSTQHKEANIGMRNIYKSHSMQHKRKRNKTK